MSEIITEIKAFEEGMPFPPYMSRERLSEYEKNLKRFSGKYNENAYIRVKNINGGKDSFPILTENFYKLITLKLQGLLLNEKPLLSFNNNVENTKILNDVINDSNFWLSFQQSFRNFSSLGTGALYLSFSNGKPKVNSVNPVHLYKIVDAMNIDHVTCYVLAQPIYNIDYKNISFTTISKIRLLYHYKGYYIERLYEYNESSLEFGKLLEEKRVETGLTDFAVFVYENCPPTDEVYGQSDYDSIKDIVGIYEQTLTLVNVVLVKNINPIIQVPTGVLVENEKTGSVQAPEGGSFVEISEGDIKYVTYDMQLQDTVAYLTTLLTEIGIQSEMSKTFLTGEFASNLSGEAIKSLLKSPLDKISRSIDQLDSTIKSLFVQMLHLVGVECTNADISIVWRDGISGTSDDLETVEKAKDGDTVE